MTYMSYACAWALVGSRRASESLSSKARSLRINILVGEGTSTKTLVCAEPAVSPARSTVLISSSMKHASGVTRPCSLDLTSLTLSPLMMIPSIGGAKTSNCWLGSFANRKCFPSSRAAYLSSSERPEADSVEGLAEFDELMEYGVIHGQTPEGCEIARHQLPWVPEACRSSFPDTTARRPRRACRSPPPALNHGIRSLASMTENCPNSGSA